jgi:MraZ protein
MFRGPSKITLDAKGRLAIPARHRDRIISRCDGKLVMTVDWDWLLLYTLPDWEELEQRLSRIPNLNEKTQQVTHMLLGHAEDVEMDGHGRILVPRLHREYARLDRQVMMIGMGKKFELWDEELWSQQMKAWREAPADGRFDKLPEVLEKLNY